MTAVGLGVATWFVPEAPISWKADEFRHDYSRDPALGTELPEVWDARSDALGRDIPPSTGRDLVVQAGGCSGCSANAVELSKLPASSFSRVFVVYQAAPTSITEASATMDVPRNVFLVSDLSGRVQMRLNAVWVGRWYTFDRGRLVRVQRRPKDTDWGE